VPEAAFESGGDRLLVARDGHEVEFVRLGAAELEWLRALAHGHALGAAVEAALRIDAAFDFGATFARHVAAGTFAAPIAVEGAA